MDTAQQISAPYSSLVKSGGNWSDSRHVRMLPTWTCGSCPSILESHSCPPSHACQDSRGSKQEGLILAVDFDVGVKSGSPPTLGVTARSRVGPPTGSQ